MERASSRTAERFLDDNGIEYRYYRHDKVNNMEDCKAVAKLTGADFCKNLFLQNRQGTEYFLLLIEQDKKFKTAEVSKLIKRSRLSFGSSEKLYEYLGIYSGAITPLGLIFDTNKKVIVLIDKTLMEMEEISVHPLVNDATVVLKTKDIADKLMKITGHEPIFIEIN